MAEKLVAVGRIAKTHGVKGEVKLIPYFEPFEQYEEFKILHVKPTGEEKAEFLVQRVRYQNKFIILKLEGFENINAAEALLNQEVEISARYLPVLEEDEFYWHDLVGLSVYDETGGFLGKVEEIFPTGSNDVLVVRREGEELLLPAIREVVLEVELKEGRLKVRPQEWLE